MDLRPGIAILSINGHNVDSIFKNEGGGHRWQHAPTGRVHTSTITVAILKEPSNIEFQINPNDLEIVTTRGSGNGGQNKNKTETCVVVTHKLTKTSVRCESERSQFQNKEIAIKTLRAKLWQDIQAKIHQNQCHIRNNQIGSGMRGDKRRTIQVQHNIVKDHITNQKCRYEDYRNGKGLFDSIDC